VWVEEYTDAAGRPLARGGRGPATARSKELDAASEELRAAGLDVGLAASAAADAAERAEKKAGAGGKRGGVEEEEEEGEGAGAGAGAGLAGLKVAASSAQPEGRPAVSEKKARERAELEASRVRVRADFPGALLSTHAALAIYAPETQTASWTAIGSLEGIATLRSWLDVRGMRERSLAEALVAHEPIFEAAMPPTEAARAVLERWEATGAGAVAGEEEDSPEADARAFLDRLTAASAGPPPPRAKPLSRELARLKGPPGRMAAPSTPPTPPLTPAEAIAAEEKGRDEACAPYDRVEGGAVALAAARTLLLSLAGSLTPEAKAPRDTSAPRVVDSLAWVAMTKAGEGGGQASVVQMGEAARSLAVSLDKRAAAIAAATAAPAEVDAMTGVTPAAASALPPTLVPFAAALPFMPSVHPVTGARLLFTIPVVADSAAAQGAVALESGATDKLKLWGSDGMAAAWFARLSAACTPSALCLLLIELWSACERIGLSTAPPGGEAAAVEEVEIEDSEEEGDGDGSSTEEELPKAAAKAGAGAGRGTIGRRATTISSTSSEGEGASEEESSAMEEESLVRKATKGKAPKAAGPKARALAPAPAPRKPAPALPKLTKPVSAPLPPKAKSRVFVIEDTDDEEENAVERASRSGSSEEEREEEEPLPPRKAGKAPAKAKAAPPPAPVTAPPKDAQKAGTGADKDRPAKRARADSQSTEESGGTHDVTCRECGNGISRGVGDEALLPCDGCTSASHPSCAGLGKVPRGAWFCSTCLASPCGVCSRPVQSSRSILCGPDEGAAKRGSSGGRPKRGCGEAFHLKCVGLGAAPEGDWWCARCRK